MSKAFTNDDAVAEEAQPPLPVGRRPVTAAGFAKLQEQQHKMVHEELPALAQAAASGELGAQAQLEALQRRLHLQGRRLALSDVVAASEAAPTQVAVGTRVRVAVRPEAGGEVDDDDDGDGDGDDANTGHGDGARAAAGRGKKAREERTYVLVGPDEVDAARGRISFASPVGQALLGRKVGERAFLKRPAGVLEVVLLEVAADDGG